MGAKLDLHTGSLEPGDRLYLATDAMAHWLVGGGRGDPAGTWPMLSAVEHPALFRRIVQSARSSRRMQNDDVTLIRIGLEVSYPRCLVVCQ
jgi:serine phosphatase RsbU (regulator of sigma subunit)